MTTLEEKLVQLKVDFKAKEAETQEMHDKKIRSIEDKINDLRTRVKSKDDDCNELSKSLKLEKNDNAAKAQEIETLIKIKENLNLELNKTINNHSQNLNDFTLEMKAKEDKSTEQISNLNQTLCCRDVQIRECHEKLERSQSEASELSLEIKILNSQQDDLETNKVKLNAEIENMILVLAERDTALGNLEETIEEKIRDIALRDQNIQHGEEKIKNLENKVVCLKGEISDEKDIHLKDIHARDEIIKHQESKLSEISVSLVQSRDTISKQITDIQGLKDTVQSRDQIIHQLEEDISVLKTNLQKNLDQHNLEISSKQTEIQDLRTTVSTAEEDKRILNFKITELG